MTDRWWQDRRVLVTGHTGFKGSWLCMLLKQLGAVVGGFSLPDAVSTPALFEVAGLVKSLDHRTGDVRDLPAVVKCVRDFQPEIVLHLAAQPLVRFSYDDPVGTYATNVMGTTHVLEAVRTAGAPVKAVVVVTTDKCYENREWMWGYREDEAMGGYDPYSSSKGAAELVVSAYRRSFFSKAGPAIASARAGNVIGGGDWAKDRLVPDILRAFEAGQPVVIRNPDSIRPWQHVIEPLTGYLMLARKLVEQGQSFAQAYNFGPHDQDAKPVSWIVRQLTAAWGPDAKSQITDAPQPHEAHFLKLDISKARGQLGWQPRLDLATALSWIVRWHKHYISNYDVNQICQEQIADYLTLGA